MDKNSMLQKLKGRRRALEEYLFQVRSAGQKSRGAAGGAEAKRPGAGNATGKK